MPQRWKETLAHAAGHLAVAVLATWPLVLSPFSRLVGHPDVDVWNHAWGPWWFGWSLAHGQLPFRTDLLMAPQGGVLWFIDPMGALLAAPLVPLLGVVGTWNTLILTWVALASVAGRRLALALGASGKSSWIGAVALACSAHVASEVHNGISEAVGVCWSVLALAACVHACRSDRWRHTVGAGLLLGLSAVASYYYGLAAGLVAVTWALLLGQGSWWRRVLRGGTLAATGSLVAAPAFAAILVSIRSPDAIIARTPPSPGAAEYLLAHNAVDPRTFLWPGAFQSQDLASLGEHFRHSSYLGWAALLLALASRRWAVLAGGAVAALFSLGPWLWWDQEWLLVSGNRLALPSRLIVEVLPFLSGTHFQRMAVPALAVVGALAAVTAARWPTRVLVPLTLWVALEGLLLGPAPWPLARAPVMDVAAHRALRDRPPAQAPGDPPIQAVLDLPVEVGATMAQSRYLFYQTASHRPIPHRPDPRFDASSLRDLPPFQVLAAYSVTREPHRAGLVNRLQDVSGIDPGQLRRHGVQFVVVHRELDPCAQRVEAQLQAWFGEPEVMGHHAFWDTERLRGDAITLPVPMEPCAP